jgi:HAAS domain-containing protein
MTSLAGPPGAVGQAIGSYLAEIADRLPGPARTRRDILAELNAGLADAIDAHRSAGLNQAQATRAAIAEFGGPGQVADGFRPELAAAQARRTALTLMIVGPLTGVLWFAAALVSRIGAQPAPPWEWVSMPAGVRLATHIAVIILVAAIGSSLFTMAVTGRLTRWLPVRPGRPAASAAIAASGLAMVDIIMLIAVIILAAGMPGKLAVLPVAAATAASLVRLTLATHAARNCFAIRAACSRVSR